MSVITLDSDQIAKLCQTAEGFALDAQAEDSLCKLLDIQDQINKFVDEVKSKIVESATKLDSDFTSLSGDRLKLEYRASGAEFDLEDHATVEEMFITRTERMGVNAEAVRGFVAEHGYLPAGVIVRKRKKTLVIKRKGEK